MENQTLKKDILEEIDIRYSNNKAALQQVISHLEQTSALFVPPLSGRVVISDYGKKIVKNCVTFEAWDGVKLVGLIAAYFNDRKTNTGFITSVSIQKEHLGKGIGKNLISLCFEYGKEHKFSEIRLEVFKENTNAIWLYNSSGFEPINSRGDLVIMRKSII